MKTLAPTTGGNTLEQLIDKKNAADRNAKRQRSKLLANPDYAQRVRPEFWEQVSNDYAKQIRKERAKL